MLVEVGLQYCRVLTIITQQIFIESTTGSLVCEICYPDTPDPETVAF